MRIHILNMTVQIPAMYRVLYLGLLWNSGSNPQNCLFFISTAQPNLCRRDRREGQLSCQVTRVGKRMITSLSRCTIYVTTTSLRCRLSMPWSTNTKTRGMQQPWLCFLPNYLRDFSDARGQRGQHMINILTNSTQGGVMISADFAPEAKIRIYHLFLPFFFLFYFVSFLTHQILAGTCRLGPRKYYSLTIYVLYTAGYMARSGPLLVRGVLCYLRSFFFFSFFSFIFY